MTVQFVPSQLGSPDKDAPPLHYTSSPLRLLRMDALLLFKLLPYAIFIIVPLKPAPNNPIHDLDELYPNRANLKAIFIHAFLIVFQIAFLISLPICVILMFPTIWFILYVFGVLFLNVAICKTLNGSQRFVESRVEVEKRPEHDSEHWVFVNGVSVGHHWLQSNVDRLAMTFGRKVTGVHNPTFGIVFDFLQCAIQRDLSYATQDVRDAYAHVKLSLQNNKYKKVILFVHSQGGIIGSLIVDWLLDDLPLDALQKLEVYTFASAANHFNNPYRYLQAARAAQSLHKTDPGSRAIRHIEHYANSNDMVSKLGVLNFARVENRYIGRLFERPGRGHMLNQHYLDKMFPLGPDRRALDVSEFMEMEVAQTNGDESREDLESSIKNSSGNQLVLDVNSPIARRDGVVRVKDLSRLWLYRNGGSPPDKEVDGSTD